MLKRVNVNGEMLYKWLEVTDIKEYDSNGNIIHYKDNNDIESWYEYTYWDSGKVKTETRYSTF